MNNLVVGGAGFIGYHLINKLLTNSEKVTCLDNFSTGREENLKEWKHNNNLSIVNHNIQEPINFECGFDKIWHLGCPASPKHYQKDPIDTLKTCFLGTYNLLEYAKKHDSKILLASTSEIYGDPKQHPQSEKYNGYVNPIGIRSCYDEGKRISETLCFDFNRFYGVEIRVARIFNTYGPKMLIDDGRVVSNFIVQAILNKKITIYGDGEQTRSFCFVSDLVNGLIGLMESKIRGPINIGNDHEITINELANLIRVKINPSLKCNYIELPQDDPIKRNPDLTRARKDLKWSPKIELKDGLDKTISYFKDELKN